MVAEKLTDRKVQLAKVTGFNTRGAKKGQPRTVIFLSDGGNLYLKVNASGTKSWVFRYRMGTDQSDIGLGPYPEITLAAARERALAMRRQRLEGMDPAVETRAKRLRSARQAIPTFMAAAEAYMAAQDAGWSASHSYRFRAPLAKYVFPRIGELPWNAVERDKVLAVIEPIWITKNVTADRLRNAIERVLDYAASRYLPQMEAARYVNPARWRGNLSNLLARPSAVRAPEEERQHTALPYSEIGQFMAKLRDRAGLVEAALEFMILTAARSGEVTGATCGEVDMANRVWTIPASRMKARRVHRVPLSDAAMAVLTKMAEYRRGDVLFPGERNATIGDSVAWRTLQRLRPGVTVHGFRGAFATWATETTGYPYEMIQFSLAHKVGKDAERAYARGDMFDRRRRLMDDWATFCAQPASGDVVPLRASSV